MTHQARFLVLRGGAIGDFIVTLPALTALRERWPDAHIELIGYPHIANLALAGGLVDHVDSLDRAEMARFFSANAVFTEAQAEYVSSFDIIFSYLHDPRSVVLNNLKLAGARQVLYGSPIVTEGPASRHLLKPLESLAIYPESDVPTLRLRPDLVKRGQEWLDARGLVEPVVIHPGSGSPKKNWPLERFLELARLLEAQRKKILFIAGEADAPIRSVLEALNPPAVLLTDATLVDVAGVLSNCRTYIGNDSGITHLAAALGLSVTALFGPSNPAIWGPRGNHVRWLTAPDGDLSRLTVEELEAQVG
jgi:heptosyltransferase-3